MITLNIKCYRCSKEVSHDMTNKTLGNDLVQKFGFNYAHDGKTNVVICNECEKLHRDLKERLATIVKTEVSDFFSEGEDDGNNSGAEDD